MSDSQNVSHRTQINDEFMLQRERDKLSSRTRRFSQIGDTIVFEFQRFTKKTGILLGVALLLFALSVVLGLLNIQRNPQAFPTVESYTTNYLSFMNMLILILATSYGTNLIVVDFQEDTGNLLFPKITKGRLFIGRLIANFILGALIIVFYYLVTLIPVFIEYQEIPVNFWSSLAFALYYYLGMLSFAIFCSSFVKRSSGAVIIVLILIIIGFPIISSILMLMTAVEPLFLLNYYANIITYIFNMPDPRLSSIEVENFTINQWFTPDVSGALIGLGIYSFVLLVTAYIIYHFRQNSG